MAHVRYVADNMREKDVEEFLAVSFARNRGELADSLVERYGAHQHAFGFSDDDDTPVGVGAMVEGRPNVITLMFFATPLFNKLALPIARFTKRRLFPGYIETGVHRIECISIAGYEEAHRWIRLCGMSEEGVFRGFGKRGETFHQFAWVADAH
ncbi:hypothetical protein LB543_04935 [Mesorhizobium sp. ESP7-2]|uniref:hypothetical protein n=1 Tax=Mesorhizobium sp. ESP7-2 TaxID=2876622 RepID=UPI001CCF950B|nr:hypothetical protein [Mesorhizobium sp. ESP7-2]MBZ9706064.1 hypothetical protein [Mesorhizobium sp. ESP7-2]